MHQHPGAARAGTGLAQGPGDARTVRAVDTDAAVARPPARRVFAGRGVDAVRVARRERDRTDRHRHLAEPARVPAGAGFDGAPDAPVRRASQQQVAVRRVDRERLDAAVDVARTELPPVDLHHTRRRAARCGAFGATVRRLRQAMAIAREFAQQLPLRRLVGCQVGGLARSRGFARILALVEAFDQARRLSRGRRQPDRRVSAGAVQLHPGAAAGRIEARIRHQLPAVVRRFEPEHADRPGHDLLQRRRADGDAQRGADRVDLRTQPHRAGEQCLRLRLRAIAEQRGANPGAARRADDLDTTARLGGNCSGRRTLRGGLGLHLRLDLADRLQPQSGSRLPFGDVACAQEPLAFALVVLPAFVCVYAGAQPRLDDRRLLLGNGGRPGSGSLRDSLARPAGHRELLGRTSVAAYVAGPAA